MKTYGRVYEDLGLPPAALDVAIGAITLPDSAAEIPFRSNGFPPALIPIWSVGTEYYGFWHHRFRKRRMTIVRLSLEERPHATEVARTFEQLALVVGLRYLCEGRGREEACRQFLEQVGLEDADFEQLVQIADSVGDSLEGLSTHRRFRDQLPLSVCQNAEDYTGDFPSEGRLSQLRSYCSIELSTALLRRASKDPDSPPWLRIAFERKQQERVCSQFVDSGELGDAWMCINSEGWSEHQLRQCVQRLQERARDASFTQLCSAWMDHRQSGY